MGMFDNTTTFNTSNFINPDVLKAIFYGNIYNNESYEDHDPNIIDVEYKEIKEEIDSIKTVTNAEEAEECQVRPKGE